MVNQMVTPKMLRAISFLLLAGLAFAAPVGARQAKWRAATEKELADTIPARAPVEKEQIETESRTASGITNGKGQFIAGVVIITTGYAAEGKYSHFFLTQVPIKIGEMKLGAGQYVFGYKRSEGDTLAVRFYEAATGRALGTVKAHRESAPGAIRSLTINPPNGEKGTMLIGRFALDYFISQ